RFAVPGQRVRSRPGDRLDAADPGGRSRLVGETERRDLARGRDMGPAAQLERDAGHVDHPYDVAVLLGEERYRASGDRVLVLHLARFAREVFPVLRVYFFFDSSERGV